MAIHDYSMIDLVGNTPLVRLSKLEKKYQVDVHILDIYMSHALESLQKIVELSQAKNMIKTNK